MSARVPAFGDHPIAAAHHRLNRVKSAGVFTSPAAGLPASAKKLADLCHRVALSLDSGIDVLRVWRGEADRATGRAKQTYQDIATAIESGEPLDEAIAAAAPFFPPLFVEMSRVGERSGALPETLRRLGQHYEHRVRVARDFRAAIAWPMLQLLAALGIVGILILIAGILKDGRGGSVDLLGFGLAGANGLTFYISGLASLTLIVGLSSFALMRRPDWSAAIRGYATRLPAIGSCLEKIALARIAWALRLALNVEMDLRSVASLVLRVSGNRRFSIHGPTVAAAINEGRPLSQAFAETGVFPRPFLDELEVAEESGRIVESMDRLSKRYEQEAESATQTLAGIAGGLVWLGVASLIIMLIFRVFSFYTGAIYDALDGI